MAIKKLINLNTNGTQVEYSGVLTSSGAGSSGEIPALDAVGRLDVTMMPTGFGQDATTATAGEAIAAGDFVYFNASGNILKADATVLAKQARGYVIAAVANAAIGTVFYDDSNTSVTGLTPGVTYFLSNTPGGVTSTPTTVAGQICQEVGFAVSATVLRVNIQEAITRV
jgi:hypothetical protein